MNFKQLETFYWAAKLGSFSAATERLNTTQSTVSMRIIELERDLGIELFDRSQRVAKITTKGRDLMAFAESILRMSAEMREQISSEEAMPGVVRLGVAEVISLTWLPRLVKAIHERFPRVTLQLDEALTHELVDRLENGSLDVILAPGRAPGYNFSPLSLGTVEFRWMASPDLGVPDHPIGPHELQQWPLIALARESYHHTSIEDWFKSANASCRRIDTCRSMGVAASLAAAGLGITLLPPSCYAAEIASGRLRQIETTPVFPPVEFTATRSAESLQPLTQRIVRMAREISDFDKSTGNPGAAEVGPARRTSA